MEERYDRTLPFFLSLAGQKENRDRKRYAGNKENFQEICE